MNGIHSGMDRLQSGNQGLLDDFRRILEPRTGRALPSVRQSIARLVDRKSITVAMEPGADIRIIYHLSLFLPANAQRADLFSDIWRCRNLTTSPRSDPADQAELDETEIDESLLLSLLQNCLPLFYSWDASYRLVDIRSTRACQALSANRGRSQSDAITVGQLTWPKTQLGKMARPVRPCVVSSRHSTYAVHRSCLGDFHQGTSWAPIQVYSR